MDIRPSKKRRANELANHDAVDVGDHPAANFDAEIMQQQLELFVRNGDVDSAQILGELLVSVALSTSTSVVSIDRNDGEDADFLARRSAKLLETVASDAHTLSPAFHAKTLRLFGDLMLAKRECKRAIRYYCGSCKDGVLEKEEDLEVKLKIARCYVQLNCIHEAIEVLKSTPLEERSLSMNLLLGKLYVNEGLQNKAEESYMTALRQNPYALEAAVALTELAAAKDAPPDAFAGLDGAEAAENAKPSGKEGNGVSFKQHDIERFYEEIATTTSMAKNDGFRTDIKWMQTLVAAHMDAERGNYRSAVVSFTTLERIFPKNLHCLVLKGALEIDQELLHQAHISFKRARQVDDLNLAYMDSYANCLRKAGARTNLNDLVHELFAISSTHAESWLAAAYYNDLKGDHETALQFCDRAINGRSRHAPAHLLRGEMLLRMHHPQPALKAFWTACRLRRSLEAYTGIITSYCDLYAVGVNRYKEALSTAKSVVKLFPQKAQSFVLLGSVLALSPEHRDQAQQVLQKALAMEPRKLSTNFALADLLVGEGNLRGAIDRLQAFGERYPRDEVFTKLAYVYSLDKQYAEALKYFHQALRLNPGSTEAVSGLDRLEKLMRGEDPDDLNNTMEQMEPVDPEDSVEASEYLSS
ncbi:Anaphase promoting complex subunit 7 [Phytophthora boehmeriae]|uniref:Anaphase promoting complex subunit 7 n=1 Tax=Phytophthora boehmeriae TaxID=109152 RepID=A0A8T1X1Q6_9STRA|nr:Anaphase promoting complex subunit 7 [Phytophthora boehmeriae]